MADRRNRAESKKATNDWLSPPELLQAAGKFDLDPACYPVMPWRTAERMVSNQPPYVALACNCGSENPKSARHGHDHLTWCLSRGCETTGYPVDLVSDGLAIEWDGRVWLNPPWDDPLPWARKMARHGEGLMLVSAKSTDTKWAQVILAHAHAVLFFQGRLLYHYPDGTKSEGAWTPSMLAGFGEEEVEALEHVRSRFPGALLVNPHREEYKA